jgi:hypothetical protein
MKAMLVLLAIMMLANSPVFAKTRKPADQQTQTCTKPKQAEGEGRSDAKFKEQAYSDCLMKQAK